MLRTPIAALAAGLLLPGCTGGGGPRPTPTGPEDAARARLAALTARVAGNTFDATYRLTEALNGESGTIRIRQKQAPRRYRVDLSVGGTASFFAIETGIVSCTQEGERKTWSCFLVARPGEPVPPLFDPGVQRLFDDAVRELSAHPEDYSVKQIVPQASTTASPAVTGQECFRVERRNSPTPSPGGAAAPGFETGEYCFAESGIPTRFSVEVGRLELVELHGTPADSVFRPPATPATLPSLSATPSPSR